MDLNDGERRGTSGSGPLSQGSIYSLTFDEFQNTFDGIWGGLDKDFGSMSMDELLRSIWTTEESQAMASAPVLASASTAGAAGEYGALGSASAAGVAGEDGAALQRQGSLTLQRDSIREGAPPGTAGGAEPQPNRQPTLGEMTLEEFLVRAGVVRDIPTAAAMAAAAAAAAVPAQPVAQRPILAMSSEPEDEIDMRTEIENMEVEDTAGGKSGDDEVIQIDGTEENNEGEVGDGNGKGKNARKPMETRSEMWLHFIKIKDEQGVVKKGKCKYCSRPIKADSYINGTTALRRHFNICKRNPHVNCKDLKQATLQATKGEGISTWIYDPEAMREAFTEMVIEDELPFVFGERRGFKKFMSIACPHWSTPSRRACARDTIRIYFQEKAKLKLFFKENCERVCLTTDCWNSQQYMTVTAHFIDKNWQLHRKVISFFKVEGHKGDVIGKNLHKCLLEWRLEKVMCVTVDNASANDSGVSYLRRQLNTAKASIAEGKYLHMRCAAHIINLIVQDGLKEVDASVKRVRAAVRYIKNGTSQLVKFKELAEEEKIDSKEFLKLDNCARWNSTYLMLKAAITYEKVFARYLEQEPSYATDLSEERKGPGHPDDTDWENAKRMTEFLGHFFVLTERLSTTMHVTSCNFFFEIGEVHFLINSWMSSDDPLRKEMGKRMKDKYDKYWGTWLEPTPDEMVRNLNEWGREKGKEKENMNLLIFVAAALDPRYKLSEYTKLAIAEMFGEENGLKVWAAVKECVHQLFEEYTNLYAPPGASTQAEEPRGRMKSLIARKVKLNGAGSGNSKSELEKYLAEYTEPENNNFDILGWWKVNSSRFPVLAQLARDVLAIPVSTVASEAVFSTTGRILDEFRTSLTPFMVQALVCTQDWLQRARPINIQEDMEQLAELEKELIEEFADTEKGKRKWDASVARSQGGSKSRKTTPTTTS